MGVQAAEQPPEAQMTWIQKYFAIIGPLCLDRCCAAVRLSHTAGLPSKAAMPYSLLYFLISHGIQECTV